MQSILRMALVLAVTYSGRTQIAKEAPTDADFKWQPPAIQAPVSLPQSTIPQEMVMSVRVSKVLVVLQETRLRDVQRRLLPQHASDRRAWDPVGGSIGHRGDAGNSLAWLCYYGADAEGRWALWLESSEIAGGTVDGFILQRLDGDARMDRRCGNLQTDRVELPLALRLGMTEAEARKVLGPPTLKFRGTLVFHHEHTETLHNEPYTASNTVYLVLRKGVVWAIRVDKHTTS